MSDKATTRDIVKEISRRTGITQVTATKVIDSFFDVLAYELSNNKEVMLHGLGKFYISVHSPRIVNRVDREPIPVGEYTVVNFKMAKKYKDKINDDYFRQNTRKH